MRRLDELRSLLRLLAVAEQRDAGLLDAEHRPSVHVAHDGELREPLRLTVGVGTDIEDERLAGFARKRCPDRRTRDAGNALDREQRGGEHRPAVARADHGARLPAGDERAAAHERRVALGAHRVGRMLVHLDDLAGVDDGDRRPGSLRPALATRPRRPRAGPRASRRCRARCTARSAPRTISVGAWSPPIASTAIGSGIRRRGCARSSRGSG